ncbi:hypothetical protein BLA29_012420, partial [Euroglyphus maynei]
NCHFTVKKNYSSGILFIRKHFFSYHDYVDQLDNYDYQTKPVITSKFMFLNLGQIPIPKVPVGKNVKIFVFRFFFIHYNNNSITII